MRLIWSALWGAFPREIHLISEFLIPSLRGPVLAPFATPQEVEGARGGREPHAKGEGHGSLAAPGPHGPGASPNCLRLGGVWSLGSGPGPCLQHSGSHASAFPHRDRKLWAREGETGKGAEGWRGELVQVGAAERVYMNTSLHAQSTQKRIW